MTRVKRWSQRSDLLSMQSLRQQQTTNTYTVRSLIYQWKELTWAFSKHHSKSSSSCLRCVPLIKPAVVLTSSHPQHYSSYVFFLPWIVRCVGVLSQNLFILLRLCQERGKNLILDQHFNYEMLCEVLLSTGIKRNWDGGNYVFIKTVKKTTLLASAEQETLVCVYIKESGH